METIDNKIETVEIKKPNRILTTALSILMPIAVYFSAVSCSEKRTPVGPENTPAATSTPTNYVSPTTTYTPTRTPTATATATPHSTWIIPP
jgi:hypothetical protein